MSAQRTQPELRIAFFGWGAAGKRALQRLLALPEVAVIGAVVPSERETAAISAACADRAIPMQPFAGDWSAVCDWLAPLAPDLGVVASFPKLFPSRLLELPALGFINVHAAALPRWRGMHPINWAIIADDPSLGVSVHYLNERTDAGDVLAQAHVPLTNRDDAATMREALGVLGAQLLADVVLRFARERTRLPGTPQDESRASFAPKRGPKDGRVDFRLNSRAVFNLVRALKHPYPNAFAMTGDGVPVAFTDVFRPEVPGVVIAHLEGHAVVTTGDGVILLRTDRPLPVGTKLE